MVIGAGGPVFLGKPFMAAMANPTQEPLWKMKPAEVSATPTVSTAMLQAAAGCCRLLGGQGGWWLRATMAALTGGGPGVLRTLYQAGSRLLGVSRVQGDHVSGLVKSLHCSLTWSGHGLVPFAGG